MRQVQVKKKTIFRKVKSFNNLLRLNNTIFHYRSFLLEFLIRQYLKQAFDVLTAEKQRNKFYFLNKNQQKQ